MTAISTLDQVGEAGRFAALHASQCHLAVHIGHESVELCVSDPARGEIIFAQQLACPSDTTMLRFTAEQMAAHPVLCSVFRKTSVSLAQGEFCLIPRAFFREDDARLQLEFTTGKPAAHLLHHQAWQGDIVITESIAHAWYDMLTASCPAARITHAAAVLTEAAYRLNPRRQPSLLLWLDAQHMIIVATAQQLLLCNRYETARAEDALFYLANAAVRLGFDLETTPVWVAGHPGHTAELLELLSAYAGQSAALKRQQLIPESTEVPDRPVTLSEIQVICV